MKNKLCKSNLLISILASVFLLNSYLYSVGSISGTISYSGEQTGLVVIALWTTQDIFHTSPSTYTSLTSTGSYTWSGIEDGTYYAAAVIFTQGKIQKYDPWGVYGSTSNLLPINISGNNVSGVDITLVDGTDEYPNPFWKPEEPLAQSQHWQQGWRGDGYYVHFQVPGYQNAISVIVEGPGIVGDSITLVYDEDYNGWVSWKEPAVSSAPYWADNPPEPPLTYYFTIVFNTDPYEVEYTTSIVYSWVDFATNLSPSGVVTSTPTFSWTPPQGNYTYGIEVNDYNMNRVWNVYGLTQTSIEYGGPQLVAGTTYYYYVIVRDEYQNLSFARGSFLYQPAPPPIQPLKISGQIIYNGSTSTGTYYVWVSTEQVFGAPAYNTNGELTFVVLSDTGSYTIENLIPNLSYYVMAARDVNPPYFGQPNVYPFTADPTGVYQNNPIYLTSDVSNVDIEIMDPPPSGTISGQISYSGQINKDLLIILFNKPRIEDPVSFMIYPAPNNYPLNYSLTGLPVGVTYYLVATMFSGTFPNTIKISEDDPWYVHGNTQTLELVGIPVVSTEPVIINFELIEGNNPFATKPFEASARSHHSVQINWSEGVEEHYYNVSITLDDRESSAISVQIKGPGLADGNTFVNISSQTSGSGVYWSTYTYWVNTAPTPPLYYYIKVSTGSEPSQQFILIATMTAFLDVVSNPSPEPYTNLTSQLTQFSWTAPQGVNSYFISLIDRGTDYYSATQIWYNNPTSNIVSYNGPPLQDGHYYEYSISAFDTNGNSSNRSFQFSYNAPADKLLVTVPGEIKNPLSWNGKTGSPQSQFVSSTFTVTVYAVNKIWAVDSSFNSDITLNVIDHQNWQVVSSYSKQATNGVAVFNISISSPGIFDLQPMSGFIYQTYGTYNLTVLKTGYISGKVTKTNTNIPLKGTIIEVLKNSRVEYTTICDDNGEYLIQIATGSYTVRASSSGYVRATTTVEVLQDSTSVVNFTLEPAIGYVNGYVRTSVDSSPLAGAKIEVLKDSVIHFVTTCNTEGYFSIELPIYNYESLIDYYNIKVSTTGYEIKTSSIEVQHNSTSTVNFYLHDISSPTVKITFPENASTVSSLINISGTVTDIGIGLPNDAVKLYIKRLADNYYWNGSSWTETVVYLPANLQQQNWSYTSLILNNYLTDGASYYISVKASDKENNTSFDSIIIYYSVQQVVNYYIKGYVKDGLGNPLSGVTVNLSGKISKSTTTADDGSYGFYELTSGSYTVTPIKDGWRFEPLSRTTETLSANITNWDFVGTQIVQETKFSISGYIKDTSGNGISGVSVSLSGTISKSTITPTSGYYEFSDLPTGSYTVTATKLGWEFDPVTRTTETLSGNITNWDFIGKPKKFNITGRVAIKNEPDKGIPLVVIQVFDEGNNRIASFTTDDSGRYEFKDLDGDKSYTIIPEKENWDFEPSSYTVYLVTNTIINFDGIYQLANITPTKIDLPLGENNQIVTVNMPKPAEVKIIVGGERSDKPKEQRGTVNPDKGENVAIVFNPNKKPDEYIGQKFTIKIFTLTGELIEEFTKTPQTADDTWIKWIPKDIASGIYIVYVEGPGIKVHKKIAIVR